MPVIADHCPNCNSPLSWEKDSCLGCGHYVGPPNIREVESERDALSARYEQTVEASRARGCLNMVIEFIETVAQDSVAVINMWPSFLAQFLNGEKSLYSGYALQTEAETRWAANLSNDRERRGTEGTLFGVYGPQIRCAALSIDGIGLVSYGS